MKMSNVNNFQEMKQMSAMKISNHLQQEKETNKKSMMGDRKMSAMISRARTNPACFIYFPQIVEFVYVTPKGCPLGATSRKPVVPKLPSNKRPETGEAVEELSKNLPRFFVPLCMWSIFTCLFLLHVFSTAAPNQAYFCVWGG